MVQLRQTNRVDAANWRDDREFPCSLFDIVFTEPSQG
jgi:hypothetical protein